MRITQVLALAMSVLAAGCAFAAEPSKPSVIILGSPHFGNPSRDNINVEVEDVLTAARQREIEAVVERLAAFRPTHVAVEWKVSDQAGLDKRYQDYRAGRYILARSEQDQIGLRLAAKLGLPRVEAIDWNDNPPGPESAYDFPAWMTAHGREAEWKAFLAKSQAEADATNHSRRCQAVADWYRYLAEPKTLAEAEAPYFEIATFGDAAENPGAAWVGTWAARNLRILANLQRVAGKPNDRTVVIYGFGHAPLLSRFGRESGTFAVVDPRGYLPPASRARC